MDFFGIKDKLLNERVLSSIRAFFINTLFDSTFTLLGVIVGSAFIPNPNIRVIIGTLITSSIALGISSGISVYEAETLERQKQVEALEEAMLTDLDGTRVERAIKGEAIMIAITIFLTPLLSCTITTIPFIVSMFGVLSKKQAGWSSIILAISILFFAGVYFGKEPKEALYKGLRMAVFGTLAFLFGVWIQSLI